MALAEGLIGCQGISRFTRHFIIDPYPNSFKNTGTIFIHVPKCAGMSVQKILYGVTEPIGHMSAINYQLFDSYKFDNYFKFTFVRNPWDRFLSAYYFLKKGGISQADAVFSARYLQPHDSFGAFVRSLENERVRSRVLDWIHFRPQYLFLADCSMSVTMDFIGRVENFEQDLNQVMLQMKKSPAKIEMVNRTQHPNRQDIYGKTERGIVRELYARDIELFNYDY